MNSILWISAIVTTALIGFEIFQKHGHIPKLNGYDGERDIILKQRLKDISGK